jgi:hypothetical protein
VGEALECTRPLLVAVEEDEQVDENEEAEVGLEEDEGDEWKWEDEEVLTVTHAWPEGVDTERSTITPGQRKST